MWENLNKLRNKTALFLIPSELYYQQKDIAERLPEITVIDWLSTILSKATPSNKFINSNVDLEINKIREIGNSSKQNFCIINSEYFLARFNLQERDLFWQNFRSGFPYMEGLIVLFVLNTPELLPNKLDLNDWKKQERLFSFEEVFKEI